MSWTLGQSQLGRLKILPIYALILTFDDGVATADTYRLELLESDSSLAVQGVGEANDLGSERLTAVVINGKAVVMHNAYSDTELRDLKRRLARESHFLTDVRFELKPLSGQDGGATMQVGVDGSGAAAFGSTVRSISVPPWAVEWIPTERPRLNLSFTIICSIDVLEDYDDSGTLKSRLFHHIEGF